MKVQIVCHDNKAGLSRDRQITRDVLKEAGHQVTMTNNKVGEYNRQQFDVNIFHEILDMKYFRQARKNIFFPNPEWFFDSMKAPLDITDVICAKTRDCERLFKGKGRGKVVFTSFTSEDRKRDIPKSRQVIHTCGKSEAKGTIHVKNAWSRHADLPYLTLIESDRHKPIQLSLPNMRHTIGKITENALIELQNKCMIHLCPSNYEGFGHYIWEAKSCGSVVVTNNIPPMNEFVNPRSGMLLDVSKRKRRRLAMAGETHHVYITEAMRELADMPGALLKEKGDLARKEWEENDKFFKTTLVNLINSYE